MTDQRITLLDRLLPWHKMRKLREAEEGLGSVERNDDDG